MINGQDHANRDGTDCENFILDSRPSSIKLQFIISMPEIFRHAFPAFQNLVAVSKIYYRSYTLSSRHRQEIGHKFYYGENPCL